MYIEELKEGDVEAGEENLSTDSSIGAVITLDAKKVLVLAGARALFYPTLVYNVVRNKIQSDFRWWDRVDEFILLGAVPFPAHVPCLKELGVRGVVTLNEPYETLVPSSLYFDHGIEHLVIPTRDYLFAPSYGDICQAVEFINENGLKGKTTYVHCKAGRGRSTTIVLCYLVEHKQMMPDAALEYVRSIRPRVRLAAAQWQAVKQYYLRKVMKGESTAISTDISLSKTVTLLSEFESEPFDYDGSVVLITESDLDGYDSDVISNEMFAEGLSVACRVQFVSQAAIARLSYLWVSCNVGSKMLRKKSKNSADQIGSISVDIRVY
jgi:atypical dual specificity phosphatase